MRAPFSSERRCISNLIEMEWRSPLRFAPTIVSEYIAPPIDPGKRPWFNCDFTLDFIDPRTASSEHVATMSPVLPNTLGAEVFLVVQKELLAPMRLELIGGGAFSIKYYTSYLDNVEAAIREAVELRERRETRVPWHEMVEAASMRRAAFARLLVVGTDATFLYFPGETAPLTRGQRFSLVQRDDRDIDCYVDGDKVVCFDGWIRAEVTPTERTLVALPKGSA